MQSPEEIAGNNASFLSIVIQHEVLNTFCTSSCDLIRRFAVEGLQLESRPCPRLITCWKLADTGRRTMATRREQRDAITSLLIIKSLKSWNICCKQQPEALDRQDVQERELEPTSARCCRCARCCVCAGIPFYRIPVVQGPGCHVIQA